MNAATVVISTHASPDSRAADLERAVVDQLERRGVDLLVMPHLYHLDEHSPLWQQLADQAIGPLVIVSWLHPRPAEWTMRRHRIAAQPLTALDFRTFDSAAVGVSAVQGALGEGARRGPGPGRVTRWEGASVPRWYPVVDGSRCSNCHHCLQFCLFGVYALDDAGQLVAQNPDSCKTGCPACSRICPQGAIMFPLYDKDEVIAGAPGRFMTPDLAARRMFYTRTGRPCPQCGAVLKGQKQPAVGGPAACPECGTAPAAAPPAAGAFEDLDVLVEQLDLVMRRRN